MDAWNPDHLNRDELHVEYLIRQIEPQSANARTALDAILKREAEGEVLPPSAPHKLRSINSEVAVCSEKYIELEKLTDEAISLADEFPIAAVSSRLTHLRGRLLRIAGQSEGFPGIARLQIDTLRQLEKISAATLNMSYGEERSPFLEDLVDTAQSEIPSRPTRVSMGAISRHSLAESTASAVTQRKSVGWGDRGENTQTIPGHSATISREGQTGAGFVPITYDSAIVTASHGARGSSSEWHSMVSNNGLTGQRPIAPFDWSLWAPIGAPVPATTRSLMTTTTSRPHTTSALNAQAPVFSLSSGSDVPTLVPSNHSANHTPRPSNLGLSAPAAFESTGFTFRGDPVTLISKWKIMFDGGSNGLTVEDFVFRAESMARGARLSQSDLYNNLHIMLTDKSARWYWNLRRANLGLSCTQLRTKLLHSFRNQDTDYDIRKELDARRQGAKEPFLDFSVQMGSIAARMITPMPESELVEILRRNMAPYLQRMLFRHPTQTVDSLSDLCREAEILIARQRSASQSQVYDQRRAVHEMSYEQSDADWLHGSQPLFAEDLQTQIPIMMPTCDGNVDAMQFSARRPRTGYADTSLWICWNCKDIGHAQVDCPKPNRGSYCLGCGMEGVLKPNCPKCKQRTENRAANVMNSAKSHSQVQMSTQRTNANRQ